MALLKSLPKATRRHFVPTPDHARAALAGADPGSGRPFTEELARVLKDRTGVAIPPDEWDWARVPDHLRPTFAVEGPGGRLIARGKDLDALRPSSQGAVRQRLAKAGASIERSGLTAWTLDDVPRTFEGRSAGHTVQGFPALVDEGTSVSLRVLDDAGAAEAAHRAGVRRLLLLNTTAPWKRVLATADQRAEARARPEPARLRARPPRGLPRGGRGLDRRRAGRGRGAHRGPSSRTPTPPSAPTSSPACSRSSRPSSRCSRSPRTSDATSTRSTAGPPRARLALTSADVGPSSTGSSGPGSSPTAAWRGSRTSSATSGRCSSGSRRLPANPREAPAAGPGRRDRDGIRRPPRRAPADGDGARPR